MICAQCKSEVIDLNGVCPNCGTELVKGGEDPARVVQNVSGGITLSAGEQINVQGDVVGRDKVEVKNDYSVTNTVYQFNLIADRNGQIAGEPRLKSAGDPTPILPTPGDYALITKSEGPQPSSQKSSSFKLDSPLIASTQCIWRLPLIDAIFGPSYRPRQDLNEEELRDNCSRIEAILSAYNAPSKVVRVDMGPTITRYYLEPSYRDDPELGVLRTRVADIRDLEDQITAAFDVPVRLVNQELDRSYIGIEIPNSRQQAVLLRNLIRADNSAWIRNQLSIGIGEVSSEGTAVVDSLETIHHLFITGTSGSGKSNCIQTILTSLLMKNSPNDLRLLLIDPSGTRFREYVDIPHLALPVITNKYIAVETLEKMLVEMEVRYDCFSNASVRTVFDYDSVIAKDNKCLPYLVIIIENLSKLVEVDPESVERMLVALTEKSHHVGIHLVASSPSPLNDAMIRLLKYCFPANFVLALNSVEESISVLEQAGAECLRKPGDMLIIRRFYTLSPQRIQAAAVTFDELTLLLNYWKIQQEQTDT